MTIQRDLGKMKKITRFLIFGTLSGLIGLGMLFGTTPNHREQILSENLSITDNLQVEVQHNNTQVFKVKLHLKYPCSSSNMGKARPYLCKV